MVPQVSKSLINRNDYPALNFVLWDIHTQFLEPELVFNQYQQKWAYVKMFELTPEEKELIKLLAQKFGNGVLIDKSFKSDTYNQIINIDVA